MILTISNSSKLNDDNLEYNLEKVRRQDATIIHAQGIRIFSERFQPDSEHVKEEFMRHLRCACIPKGLPFTHISINPDPRDHLSVLELRQIARTLLEWGGLQDCPYLAFRHQDAHHDHIHLLVCRMSPKGIVKGRIWTIGHALKIEDAFHLHKKEMRLFKKERMRLEKIRQEEGSLTDQVRGCLRAIQTLYSFQDLETYRDLAAERNISIAVSRDKASAVQAISHFITDDEGRIISGKIPTHTLGSRYALKSVLEMAQRNLSKALKPSLFDAREDLKEEVLSHLASAGDLETALETLLKKGIEIRKARSGSLILMNHLTGKVQREDALEPGGLMERLLLKTHLDHPLQVFFLVEDHHRRNHASVLKMLEQRIQILEKKNLRFSQHAI